jgi:hypothetical protein
MYSSTSILQDVDRSKAKLDESLSFVVGTVDNLDEVLFERGPSDQEPIYIVNLNEFLAVVLCDTPSVDNPDLLSCLFVFVFK